MGRRVSVVSHSELFNAGATGWQVIERGAPAPAIHSITANAVPAVDDWQTLSGAHGPAAITLRRWTRTWWPFEGAVSVDFTVVLKFEYGARYRGGGLFIPNVYVEVPECWVGWRYDVDVDVTVGAPENANSRRGPDRPHPRRRPRRRVQRLLVRQRRLVAHPLGRRLLDAPLTFTVRQVSDRSRPHTS